MEKAPTFFYAQPFFYINTFAVSAFFIYYSIIWVWNTKKFSLLTKLIYSEKIVSNFLSYVSHVVLLTFALFVFFRGTIVSSGFMFLLVKFKLSLLSSWDSWKKVFNSLKIYKQSYKSSGKSFSLWWCKSGGKSGTV